MAVTLEEKKAAKKAAEDASKGKATPPPVFERIAQATERVAVNTDPANLNQQMFGGSTLANNAVSKRNLGEVTGAGGNSQLEGGLRMIRSAFYQIEGGVAMANRRAAGG